jgi:hypothetical protein
MAPIAIVGNSYILHPEDQRVTEVKICDSFFLADFCQKMEENSGKPV